MRGARHSARRGRFALAGIPALQLVVALAVAGPAPVLAQAADEEAAGGGGGAPAPEEVARARFYDGAAAYRKGHYKDAIDLFLEADRLAPSAALSFNIARAYEKIRDGAGALRWYRDYLRRSPDATDREEVERAVRALEQELERKGVQQITVLSDPPGATVVIDEEPRGVTPFTGELPPGKRRLALRLRGYADVEREVQLPSGRALDVEVRLVPAPAAAPPPQAAPAASEPPQTAVEKPEPRAPEVAEAGPSLAPWTWAALGAGTAVLGAAGGFELLRRSAEEDARGERTQVGYAEALDRVERRQMTARILAGVGGALVLVGGTLLVLDLGSSPGETTVGLGCGSAGCGAVAGGRF